jgi:hypothetical protein
VALEWPDFPQRRVVQRGKLDQVLLGQGIVPRGYDPLVKIKSDAQIEQYLGNIAATIDRCIDVMQRMTSTLPNIARRKQYCETPTFWADRHAVGGLRIDPVSPPEQAEIWVTTDGVQKLTPHRISLLRSRDRRQAIDIDTAKRFRRSWIWRGDDRPSAELLDDRRKAVMAVVRTERRPGLVVHA